MNFLKTLCGVKSAVSIVQSLPIVQLNLSAQFIFYLEQLSFIVILCYQANYLLLNNGPIDNVFDISYTLYNEDQL